MQNTKKYLNVNILIDEVWNLIVESRDTNSAEFISHEQAWK